MNNSLEIHLSQEDLDASLRSDVRHGLSSIDKWLPPKWFYDARGSELFTQITRLAEYYPTACEREILAARAAEIASHTTAKTLIELGSGSSEKTRLLLDALRQHGSLGSFVPFDVSDAALRDAVGTLEAAYPSLEVHGIVGDFTRHLRHLPAGGSRLVAFLGGTIGNLLPDQRHEFLSRLRQQLEPGEWLLLGADLVKTPDILLPAYDDPAGITAEFNRNVLRVLNHRLGADFDAEQFTHVARWDDEREWIEMRLRARQDMQVKIRDIDMDVSFAAGEELRTEISAKFRPSGLRDELAACGFAVRQLWTDRRDWFSLSLAEVV